MLVSKFDKFYREFDEVRASNKSVEDVNMVKMYEI